MSVAIQLALVGLVVALAAGYVLRASWKTWFGAAKSGCGSGCGKCATPPPQPEVKGRRSLPMA